MKVVIYTENYVHMHKYRVVIHVDLHGCGYGGDLTLNVFVVLGLRSFWVPDC